jgi:putative endonuclease
VDKADFNGGSMWFLYILKCKNNTLYTGITNNLKKRFKAHSEGKGARYTRIFGVLKIVYTEKLRTRSRALKRECQIKSMTKKQKLALIARKKIIK